MMDSMEINIDGLISFHDFGIHTDAHIMQKSSFIIFVSYSHLVSNTRAHTHTHIEGRDWTEGGREGATEV